ncbi:hypothetical protein MnTg02_00682 [bacterium MnTg02]|nr:hypothetical protein MnTg02_00682 [bacterium MnTg02]
MNQNWTDIGITHVTKHRQQMIEIMPVYRTDIIKTHLLEERPAGPRGSRIFFGARGAALPAFWQALGELLGNISELQIGIARSDAG